MIIAKNILARAVKGLGKVIDRKPAVEVLGCIRVRAEGRNITMTATNMEEWLTFIHQSDQPLEQLDAVIKHADLKELLSKGGRNGTVHIERLSASTVQLELDPGNQSIIRRVPVMNNNDWPEEPVIKGAAAGFTAENYNWLNQALDFASTEATRRALNGVLLEKDGIVATDGKQLCQFSTVIGVKEPVIVPRSKVIPLLKESGTLKVTDNMLAFISGEWQWLVKPVAGNYPAYRQVIPPSTQHSIAFSDEESTALIKAIPGLPKTGNNGIYIHGAEGTVTILGEDLEASSVITTTGETDCSDITIACNREYLVRALKLGFTRMHFNDAMSPVIMRGDGPDMALFMPLRSDADAGKLAKAVTGAREPVIERDCDVMQKQARKEAAMQQNTEKTEPASRPPLKMVGNQDDPFDGLLAVIEQTKAKARETLDMAGALQKEVKAAQRELKQREREFHKTQKLIHDLKKVSGF